MNGKLVHNATCVSNRVLPFDFVLEFTNGFHMVFQFIWNFIPPKTTFSKHNIVSYWQDVV